MDDFLHFLLLGIIWAKNQVRFGWMDRPTAAAVVVDRLIIPAGVLLVLLSLFTRLHQYSQLRLICSA